MWFIEQWRMRIPEKMKTHENWSQCGVETGMIWGFTLKFPTYQWAADGAYGIQGGGV